MSHLVVLGLDNREDAERVFDLTGDLARQQLLQQSKAAVFILARSATVDKVVEALKPYGPTILPDQPDQGPGGGAGRGPAVVTTAGPPGGPRG
jgi:uncharacterized membrane protein